MPETSIFDQHGKIFVIDALKPEHLAQSSQLRCQPVEPDQFLNLYRSAVEIGHPVSIQIGSYPLKNTLEYFTLEIAANASVSCTPEPITANDQCYLISFPEQSRTVTGYRAMLWNGNFTILAINVAHEDDSSAIRNARLDALRKVLIY